MVSFDTSTGTPTKIFSVLIRRISAYSRSDRVCGFKIGITNNPQRRFRQAYNLEYNEMIVIYETQSIDSVSQLEARLIDHNWGLADNQVRGGGGDIGKPPYFLYIVLR